jgi:hypothetical protein|tara:strand:+ start:1461 stop:1889 length:429 start_codon:yes stop_codon:yes gene_type:complete
MNNKIAIFSKSDNKVIDAIFADNIKDSIYHNRDDLYEYYNIPDYLIDYPVKIIKNNDTYEISIDDNLLELQLPIIIDTIRIQRNNLIKKTDYLLLEDVISDKIKIKEYRQYLRDIPNNITLQSIKNNINIKILTYEEYINLL